MIITAYSLALRYIGVNELAGVSANHPLIQWWLSLCRMGLQQPDEIAWCSAFVNGIAWELNLPRSQSAAARSWLSVGTPVAIPEAKAAFDVCVFKRGSGEQPGPDTLDAPGHVGFYAGRDEHGLWILGGNQANGVRVAVMVESQLLGVRRLDGSA